MEWIAERYSQLKQSNAGELAELAMSIIDAISLPSFSFPLKEETSSGNSTTTYLYEDHATFPALYEFLGELLHSKVPLEVRDAKFGPGEIIVNKEDRKDADVALARCIKELQELVHAKESEILSKYADAH